MEQTFGEFVAARRTELGIPLSTFADLVGRSSGTVRSWERGRARPGDPKTLAAVAAVLDVEETHLTVLAGGERLAPPPAPTQPGTPADVDEQGEDPQSEPAEGALDEEPASDDELLPWVTTDAPAAPEVPAFPTEVGAPLADDRVPWLPLPPAHTVIDRTDEGLRYPLRIAATIVAVVVLLLLLQWALGEFGAAIGELRTSMFG
jgi:transcriptional regulator with XRE-family HTH domain